MSTIIRNCGAGVPADFNLETLRCVATGYAHNYAGGGVSGVPKTYNFTRAGLVVLSNIGAQYYGGGCSGGTNLSNTSIPTGTGGAGGGTLVYYFAPGQTATITRNSSYQFLYQIFEVAE